MERLRHLIKEVLSTPPKKDKCNCGCHDCDNVGNTGVVLNESLVKKDILSENLRYHVDKQLPLTENTFRYGSKSFLDLWSEARYLYLREIIHVNDDDKEILLETNLGEYGMYEGKKVPLDLPMLEEDLDEIVTPATAAAIAASAAATAARGASSSGGGGESNPWALLALAVGMSLPIIAVALDQSGLGKKIIDWVKYYKLNRVIDKLRKDPEVLEFIKNKQPGIQNFLKSKLTDKEQKYIKQISWNKITKGEIYEMNSFLDKDEEELEVGDIIEVDPKAFPNFEFPYGTKGEIIDINNADYASDDLVYRVKIKYIDSQGDETETLYVENPHQYINETEKKNPPIGKPKRGGSKKFYVYVKNPKTKKIKKVSFGDTSGLSAKINNPEARRAFAARHDCKNKTDRTKASYWSCRLPRYAKLLGLKSSFSGFW